MKKKTIFKMCRNLFCFVGLIVLTYWLLFREQNMGELISIVNSANIFYILLGVGVMFLYFFIEGYNIRSILKAFGEKITILSALKYTLIGFFFSAITPAASGGQPIEIYFMNKEKISGAKATMTLLIQLCGFQISTITIGIMCAILNLSILQDGLIWLFLLGLTINGSALAIMLICIFSKKLTKKIVNIFLNILKFFKIKNIEAKKERITKGLDKYNDSSTFIKKHKLEFIKAILRVFVQIVLYYSVTFFVYKSFGLNTYNYFQLFIMQAVLYTIVSGLPLPGSIGISEAVFLKIFMVPFGKELLSGAMLLTRGITFYLFVVVSIVVVIINFIKTKDIKAEIDEELNLQ